MRAVMASLRMAALVVLLFIGLFLVSVVFPLLGQASRDRVMGAWSKALLFLAGLSLRLVSPPSAAAADSPLHRPSQRPAIGQMILSNHVSWIDIFVINSYTPAQFVAKSEIRSWPFLGYLCARVGTVFIDRGRRRAIREVGAHLRERLNDGGAIAVFPEGTTTDGTTLLPFHSNLIHFAIDAQCPIQPCAIRYLDARGAICADAAFHGDISFVASFWRLLKAAPLTVELHVLDLLERADSDQTLDRRTAASLARAAIARALGLPDSPQHVHPPLTNKATESVSPVLEPGSR